jgi:hypothetical protein
MNNTLHENTKKIIRENEKDLALALEIYLQLNYEDEFGEREGGISYGSACCRAIGEEKYRKKDNLVHTAFLISYGWYLYEEHGLEVANSANQYERTYICSLNTLRRYMKEQLGIESLFS